MSSRAILHNNKLMDQHTVIAQFPASNGFKTLVRNVITPWIWGSKAGSIGSIGSVTGGRNLIGIEWSSSSGDDILLSFSGFSSVGRGFKVDGDDSWYMPCSPLPEWLEYETVGGGANSVDIILYFE